MKNEATVTEATGGSRIAALQAELDAATWEPTARDRRVTAPIPEQTMAELLMADVAAGASPGADYVESYISYQPTSGMDTPRSRAVTVRVEVR